MCNVVYINIGCKEDVEKLEGEMLDSAGGDNSVAVTASDEATMDMDNGN